MAACQPGRDCGHRRAIRVEYLTTVAIVSFQERYPSDRLVQHDPRWAGRYERLTGALLAELGPEWVAEHVGFTSVPGLPARPVIDIALRVPTRPGTESWGQRFQRSGWTAPVAVGDHHAVFLLDGPVRRSIGHIFSAEHWPSAHVRLFADWLRRNDADREAYARLKTSLLAQDVWGVAYTDAKAAFVLDVVNRARAARGLCRIASLSPTMNERRPPRRMAPPTLL